MLATDAAELEADSGQELQEAQEEEERRKEVLLILIQALDAELGGPEPRGQQESYELPPVSPPSKPASEREWQLLVEAA